MHNLIDLAYQKGLEKLLFELVADTEEAARHTALLLGFVQLAALPAHVRDLGGAAHGLVIMELDLASLNAERDPAMC